MYTHTPKEADPKKKNKDGLNSPILSTGHLH